MKNASLQLLGVDEALRNLARVADSVSSAAAKKVFIEAAWEVVLLAKFFVPYDDKRVKGAHLRDSILVTAGPMFYTDVLVTVRYKRPGAPHAHLVEFGTVDTAAHPFMRPAAATAAPKVAQIIRTGLLKVIAAAPQ